METTQEFINSNEKRFIDELIDLLKIPSISADSKYAKDVIRAAEFIKSKLEIAGADKVEICLTKGHPIVYGEKIMKASNDFQRFGGLCAILAVSRCSAINPLHPTTPTTELPTPRER